jgi:hypothetical protein
MPTIADIRELSIYWAMIIAIVGMFPNRTLNRRAVFPPVTFSMSLKMGGEKDNKKPIEWHLLFSSVSKSVSLP